MEDLKSKPVRKRRWRSISLRAFLALVTIFAIWLAWYVPRVQRQKEAVEWATSLGGRVVYDYQIIERGAREYNLHREPKTPRWIVEILGADCFANVTSLYLPRTLSSIDVVRLKGLPNLKYVRIVRIDATDLSVFSTSHGVREIEILSASKMRSMAGVENCRKLESSFLNITQVKSLEPVRNLSQLRALRIWSSEVSNLDPLSECTRLNSLSLRGSKVKDLTPLEVMRDLEHLDLSSTRVTDFSSLAQLPRLKTLELGGLMLNDWSPLKNLKNLSSLELQRSNFRLFFAKRSLETGNASAA